MSDHQDGERSLTSACGNVTVTFGTDMAPKIELAAGAVRMFARDLADLVTDTARKAADALVEDQPPVDDELLDGAIDELVSMRDSLNTQGLMATLEQRRSAMEEPGDRADRHAQQFEGVPNLKLPDAAMRMLENSIEMLGQFKNDTPGGVGAAMKDLPMGTAKSPSKLVAIESSASYPIDSVWLSKRACEVGPKVLAAELTETAAAAVADMAVQQDEHFVDAGLDMGPGKMTALSDEMKQTGDQALADVKDMQQQREHITKLFYQGGYIG